MVEPSSNVRIMVMVKMALLIGGGAYLWVLGTQGDPNKIISIRLTQKIAKARTKVIHH